VANFSTRPALAADLDVLLGFEQGVIGAERPFDPTLKEGDIRYYDIPGMIESPQVNLIVAFNEDQLVGCGYARIESSKDYLQHRQHAYLGFMYVLPEYRGAGINRLIINELKLWAKEKGITELRLEVYVKNTAAINAYIKAGFAEHMIEMRCPC
jgi:GNAT superfamily N-acetyltransferase